MSLNQDEEEYMRRILEMMDKAFVGGYSQEGSEVINNRRQGRARKGLAPFPAGGFKR